MGEQEREDDEIIEDMVSMTSFNRLPQFKSQEVEDKLSEHSKISNEVENFLANTEKLLGENKVPESEMMSLVGNTSMAIDLFMLGLARSQASEVAFVYNQMNKLEREILSDEFLKKRSDYEKMLLHKTAQNSFVLRTNFIKEVRDGIDFNKVKGDLLSSAGKESAKVDSDRQEVVKEVLMQLMAKQHGS